MIWLPAAIVLASLAQQDDAGFESARVDGANLADTRYMCETGLPEGSRYFGFEIQLNGPRNHVTLDHLGGTWPGARFRFDRSVYYVGLRPLQPNNADLRVKARGSEDGRTFEVTFDAEIREGRMSAERVRIRDGANDIGGRCFSGPPPRPRAQP